MESILLNGRQLDVQGINELKSGLSIQEASLKTKKNGVDEIYFTANGKNYLAYGDALKIGELGQNKIATVTYKGYTGSVVAYENEINSFGEGLKSGAMGGVKKAKDAVLGAVSNTITSVGPTTTLAVGGVIGLSGLAMWRGVAMQGATPMSNMLSDLLKNGSIGALKVITLAGAIGFGVSAIAGSIGGISEALTTEKDYSTIAAVTKDGNMGATATDTPVPTPAPAQQVPAENMKMGSGSGDASDVFARPAKLSNNTNFGSIGAFLNQRQP